MFEKHLTRIFVRDNIYTEGGGSMEIIKNKALIIFILMILAVSYIGGVNSRSLEQRHYSHNTSENA